MNCCVAPATTAAVCGLTEMVIRLGAATAKGVEPVIEPSVAITVFWPAASP